MLRPPDTAATPKPALVPSAPTRGAPGLALGASQWIELFPCPSWSCPNITDSPEGLSPARVSRLPPHPSGDSSRDSGTAFLNSRSPNFGTGRAVRPGILFWEPAWSSFIPIHPQGAEGMSRSGTGALRHTEALSERGHQKGWEGKESRECSEARESFPCTAAASAGPGAAEQEQRECGRARRARSERRQGWNRSRGGLQNINRPLHEDF